MNDSPIHGIGTWGECRNAAQMHPGAGRRRASRWARIRRLHRITSRYLQERGGRRIGQCQIAQFHDGIGRSNLQRPDHLKGAAERGQRDSVAEGLRDGRGVCQNRLHADGERHQGDQHGPCNLHSHVGGTGHCAERCTTMPALGCMRRSARTRSKATKRRAAMPYFLIMRRHTFGI